MIQALPMPKTQDLSANEPGLQDRPTCLPSLLNRIFEPRDASVVMVAGEGGTGKTFSAIEIEYLLASKLHHHILTNDIFVQRVKDGWREVALPDERVRTIKTMRDFWIAYAEILKKDRFAIVVPIFDEWQKYMKRLAIYDKIVMSTMEWWSENRKFRTVPVCITQRMKEIPRQLLPHVKWYIAKSKELTNEYNDQQGTDFSCKDLGFIIRIVSEDELAKRTETEFTLRDVVEPLFFERGPWTGDRNVAKVGDICYDSWATANLTMGKVGGTEDWFDDFMDHVSSCSSDQIPDKILEFFEEGGSRTSELEHYTSADLALEVFRRHRIDMPPEASGYPVVKMRPKKGGKTLPVELNPTNLGRLTGSNPVTLARKIDKLGVIT